MTNASTHNTQSNKLPYKLIQYHTEHYYMPQSVKGSSPMNEIKATLHKANLATHAHSRKV
jgi:hypothetical protein